MELEELHAKYQTELIALQGQLIDLRIDQLDVACLISAVQLASRHPAAVESPVIEIAAGVARDLQQVIAPDENSPLSIVFDMGWQAAFDEDVQSCRVCGCTNTDCSRCIERTGRPCHWVEPDLCSACVEVAA